MGTDARYSRHLALDQWDQAKQRRVETASALVVGLGGLGCPASQYLAAAGIGRLILNDFDRVEDSNLARQILFSEDDRGRHKAVAARERLLALNRSVGITPVTDRLSAAELVTVVSAASIVLDCTDNFATRLAINAACVETETPLVSGAAVRFQGQVISFESPGRPCLACIFSEDDEALGDCQGAGVFSTVVGTIGLMMAQDVLKMLGGVAVDTRLRIFDGITDEWQRVGVSADPDCATCG